METCAVFVWRSLRNLQAKGFTLFKCDIYIFNVLWQLWVVATKLCYALCGFQRPCPICCACPLMRLWAGVQRKAQRWSGPATWESIAQCHAATTRNEAIGAACPAATGITVPYRVSRDCYVLSCYSARGRGEGGQPRFSALLLRHFCTHPLTHVLTHLDTRWRTHSLTKPFHTHSLMHPPTHHSLTYQPSHTPTYSLTHAPTYPSLTHSLTHSLNIYAISAIN